MKKVLAVTLMLALLGMVAFAKYPMRPIKIIVAFKAGGRTDTLARIIAKVAEKYLGQPVIVINKPGAAGQIGFEEIARARKDGYTIGFINTPHVVSHWVTGRSRYTLDSFELIANIVTDPGVIVVRSDSPFKTIQDLIEYAKAHPNELTAATTGAGGDDSIALTLFCKKAGIKIKDVPFSGSSAQKAALLGGHVDIGMMNVNQVFKYVEEGKVRVLAVLTEKRLPFWPDVPTLKELGYEVYSESSCGLVAPKGVPEPIIKILRDTIDKVVKDPEFIERAEKAKLDLIFNYLKPDEFKKYLLGVKERVLEAYKECPW